MHSFCDCLLLFHFDLSFMAICMQIFICGWWLCPELYLRRPFQAHASSRLDDLLEAKAKQGVQVGCLFEVKIKIILMMKIFIKLTCFSPY